MVVWRFVVGVFWLALGAVCLFARDRLVARHRATRERNTQPAMAWIVVGVLYALIGMTEVVSALL